MAWENIRGWPFKNSPRLHKLCLHCQELLNSGWRWWWWMWGNTSTTSASSSSGHLLSNIQNLEISKLEYILKIFWTSLNISSSVNQSYLEFQNSKRGVLYMVGKLKKLSTTFIQTTFPDSVISWLKNRTQPKLLEILDCVETSTWNSYISQTRSDIGVIPEALERYLSVVISRKNS